MFRGLDKDPSEIWSFARFNVSLWASVSKLFCNYSLGKILLSTLSLRKLFFFLWACFFYLALYFFIFLDES